MTSSLSNSRAIAWATWIIVSLFYAYQYVLRVMPNTLLDDLIQQFHVDAATFGQFSGIYYIGYSLIHIPIALLLDRYGPRKMISSCILLTVIGLSPLVLTDHWTYQIIGRFLVGLGSSAAILSVFKIVRMVFKENLFPRMLSFSVTIGLIGAIYGGAPVNYIRETFGYTAVIYLFAGMGILLALATYCIVPNTKNLSQNTVLSDIKEVFRQPQVLWACFFGGLMVGPLEGFADVWGTAFLKQVYGLDSTLAASLPSMIFIGLCFGAPLISLIAEKVGNCLLTIIGAGITMTFIFVLLLTYQASSGFLSLYFILVGMCCAYQALVLYKASTYVREEIIGLTTAIVNMIVMIFGYAFHTVMGYIIHAMGGTASSQALVCAIAVIPIALCLGSSGFVLLFIQERKNILLKQITIKKL